MSIDVNAMRADRVNLLKEELCGLQSELYALERTIIAAIEEASWTRLLGPGEVSMGSPSIEVKYSWTEVRGMAFRLTIDCPTLGVKYNLGEWRDLITSVSTQDYWGQQEVFDLGCVVEKLKKLVSQKLPDLMRVLGIIESDDSLWTDGDTLVLEVEEITPLLLEAELS